MSAEVPDRNLALELVRVTESAATFAARWIGRGDKNAADQAAVDAMRLMLDTVAMHGVVVIGEGEKDEAPMLYNGEQIGDGSLPHVDIAVDPLEGTRLTALGMPNAVAVIALSARGTMFDPGPCVYMEKMAGSEEIADLLDLDRPLTRTIELVAERRQVTVGDVMVVMLDRPRHEEALREVQALVAQSDLAMPRRVATGVDPKRLAMIVAVLARHAGIALGQADVFVNVAGGVRIDEPGADLAVALAIASAARRLPVRPSTAAFGEIGLTGRLREATQAERRLEECRKLGLQAVVAPNGTPTAGKIRVTQAETLRHAIKAGLDAARAEGDDEA